MSDDVTLCGDFGFHDRTCMLYGLAAFVERTQGVSELSYLAIDGLGVLIDLTATMSATSFERLFSGLTIMSCYANAGEIETSYTFEGDTSWERIRNVGRTSAEGAPRPDPEILQHVEKWLAGRGV